MNTNKYGSYFFYRLPIRYKNLAFSIVMDQLNELSINSVLTQY